MNELITAIGLMLALEGTLYAISPGGMKSIMRNALETPDQVLRYSGLAILALGVVIVWFIRG